MVGSLCLLLLALSIVLWHNRDFWFGDSSYQADTDQPAESTPVAKVPPAASLAPVANLATAGKPAHKALRSNSTPPDASASSSAASASTTSSSETPPPVVMNSRTALPPLEVEVVAGDSHRIVRPGSNSVRVDLQPGSPSETTNEAPITANSPSAADVTTNASEHVQMSSDASVLLASPVKPNYPLLARQMKVQGSVILQALIGKDGIIQNLRVVSGPHILASAAQDAVRQWHFKPHIEGDEAVETQAKITVNFTISTN